MNHNPKVINGLNSEQSAQILGIFFKLEKLKNDSKSQILVCSFRSATVKTLSVCPVDFNEDELETPFSRSVIGAGISWTRYPDLPAAISAS